MTPLFPVVRVRAPRAAGRGVARLALRALADDDTVNAPVVPAPQRQAFRRGTAVPIPTAVRACWHREQRT